MRSVKSSQIAGWLTVGAILPFYYIFILTNGTFDLSGAEVLDNLYNDMFLHLLHGSVTISKEAVGFESFTRDGQTLTYFGIFPALLRGFVEPFRDVDHLHLSRISCLIAVSIFVISQIVALELVDRSLPAADRDPVLHIACRAVILLAGPQLYLLGDASVYMEPILWAAAQAGLFNLLILNHVIGNRRFGALAWSLLATLSGLALLTRPDVGVGLCAGFFALILFAPAEPDAVSGSRPQQVFDGFLSRLHSGNLVLPVVIFLILLLIVATVNFERWGSPVKFVDHLYYDFDHRHPSRLVPILEYGEVNPKRIGLSLLYYVTGITYILKMSPYYSAYLFDLFEGIQAPPFPGLAANPAITMSAVAGTYALLRLRPLYPFGTRIILLTMTGHAVTCIVLLCALYLAPRYRMDFAPFMTMVALIGYRQISAYVSNCQTSKRRVHAAITILCACSIAASHYILIIDKVLSASAPLELRHRLLMFAPFASRAFDQGG